jgi:hypothetical protein
MVICKIVGKNVKDCIMQCYNGVGSLWRIKISCSHKFAGDFSKKTLIKIFTKVKAIVNRRSSKQIADITSSI